MAPESWCFIGSPLGTADSFRVASDHNRHQCNPTPSLPYNTTEVSPSNCMSTNIYQDDNDDFCASCRGGGDLICCDGCTRSFHLKCVDPPLANDALPDEWFCTVCISEGRASAPPPSPAFNGLFGPLLNAIEKKNPVSFRLPKDIREFFEGVITGPLGEYTEATPLKKGKDENVDLLRLREKDGSPVLCHVCGKGTEGIRSIITCGLCRLHFHMDCLDPPLAVPPANTYSKPWRCPCHVEDVLEDVVGRGRKFRRVAGRKPIKPALKRGIRNCGHIEVELNENEQDDDFVEEAEFGRVYILPEEGIKLDFISR